MIAKTRRLVIFRVIIATITAITALIVSACAGRGTSSEFNNQAPPPIPFTVYELPDCECCSKYVPYLESYGFQLTANYTMYDNSIREKFPVPPEMTSCHIIFVDGYFVEGHVPVEAIFKLLKERPALDGIVLPGMPAGSPGMDGEQTEPFFIYGVTAGKTSQFLAFPVKEARP